MERIARKAPSKDCSLKRLSPIGSDANLNLPRREPVAGSDNLAKQRAGCVGLYVPPMRSIKHIQELDSHLDAHRFYWAEVLLQRKVVGEFPRSAELRESVRRVTSSITVGCNRIHK